MRLYAHMGGAEVFVGELQEGNPARVGLTRDAAQAFESGSYQGRAVDSAIGLAMLDLSITHLEVWSQAQRRISVRYR